MDVFYYGVKSKAHVFNLTAQVCEALGHGNDEVAELQIIETACAETKLGTYPDSSPDSHGVGLCQHDQIGLDDIKQEGEQRHFDIIKEHFGYDIPTIELADLANDPLLSIICCRLSYKRIPAPIPKNVVDRAVYWKRYYNTVSGKGTVEHYLSSVEECLGDH